MERNIGPKAMVIGLDGVPFTLLGEFVADGLLPNLGKILAQGFRLERMEASVPEVSSTSWTSFMTGVNPGEHGIYGFMELNPENYKLHFPNFNDVRAPAVWEILGGCANKKHSTLEKRYRDATGRERRSIVLNVPQTYPAEPMKGVLTAGFVAPDLRKATWPENAYDYLRSIGYVSDVDASKAISETESFFRELSDALEKRRIAFEHFLTNESWDLFIGAITETDRLHHFFFDAARNPEHPRHGAFLSLYREVDAIIGSLYGKFMEMTGGKGLFMTLSDHGFTRIRKEVYLNPWLKREGYLKTDPGRRYFEQIDRGTKAFVLDPGRIYINLEGKYSLGTVRPADRKPLMEEIRSRLLSLEDGEGNRIIKEVRSREELYKGPWQEMGPDLVCTSHDGYDLKGTLSRQEVMGSGHFKGMHTVHDAHCILPRGTVRRDRLHIEELAGLILDHFASA